MIGIILCGLGGWFIGSGIAAGEPMQAVLGAVIVFIGMTIPA